MTGLDSRSFRIRFGLLAMISAAAGLGQVMLHPGWPKNHEYLAWAERTRIYAAAFARGDFLPLWWPEGALGLSSPMPLLYHKLFVWLHAATDLWIGDIKTSGCLVLFAVSVVGAFGLRRACLDVGADAYLAAAAGLTFPHLNYSVTNWLIRGALAEYSAMAIATWVLAGCIRLATERHLPRYFIPVFITLFFAHSVIAFWAIGLIGFAALLAMIDLEERRRFARHLASTAVAIAAVLGPWIVTMSVAFGQCNTDTLKGAFSPIHQTVRLSRYFRNSRYDWGEAWQKYSVQLDQPIWIGLAITIALLLLGRALEARREGSHSPAEYIRALVMARPTRAQIFVAGSIAGLFLLQHRWLVRAYGSLPAFELIQFPWRLLSFLAPLLVVGLALLGSVSVAGPGAKLRTIALAAIALNIASSPALRPIRYEWFSPDDLATMSLPDEWAWKEYWPERPSRCGLAAEYDGHFLRELRARGVEVTQGGPCRSVPRPSANDLTQEYGLTCAGAADVALPVASYGLEMVFIRTAAGVRRLPGRRKPCDPRIGVTVEAGETIVRIELPTALRLVKWLPARLADRAQD